MGGLPKTGADGLYGVVWRDDMSQMFYHVNTLMQHIDLNANVQNENQEALSASLSEGQATPELLISKVKKHINGDNVVIIWNEGNAELPEKYLRANNIQVFIIIQPLVTNYCRVKVVDVSNCFNLI